MSDHLSRAMLRFNPFEPVASGAPVGVSLWLPDRWQSALTRSLDAQLQAPGVTTLVVTGAYGSGKTHTLAWLREVALPARRILPFYFDNPGVQFYYIANELLDQIGRKELAKRLWELASSYVRIDQRSLYPEWGFEEYLRGRITRKGWDATRDIQEALLRAGITEKEQIAYQFARIVTEFPNKPYFDYQDFVPGKSKSLVAEGEEGPYFQALLKVLKIGADVESIAFLIDEFEEVSLQKKLTRKAAHGYLATLKRLISLTETKDLVLIMAMTEDGVERTRQLEPALWERVAGQGGNVIEVGQFEKADAIDIVRKRLAAARDQGTSSPSELFPFPHDLMDILRPATYENPRRLVQFCFHALARGTDNGLPFDAAHLSAVEADLYPVGGEADS